MNRHPFTWAASLTLGAALMYLLDPTNGRRRRARLRDQTARCVNDTTDASSGIARDLRNRAMGVRAWLQRTEAGPVDDGVLAARVRSALGRATSHPGSIGVTSVSGIVTLTGPVLAREYDALYRAVSRVPGVEDVIDHLTVHEDAGSIPGLQGGVTVAF
jgi:osmotically-inducible protein OsmY